MIRISFLDPKSKSSAVSAGVLGPEQLVGFGPRLDAALAAQNDGKGRYIVLCFDADTATTCSAAGFPTVCLRDGKPGRAVSRGVWQALRERTAVVTVLGNRDDMGFEKREWMWVSDGACREGIALRCVRWDRLDTDKQYAYELDEAELTRLISTGDEAQRSRASQ